jgi:hypothetical protein
MACILGELSLSPLHHLPKLHFQLFGRRQEIDKKCSNHHRLNHLTSINGDIKLPNDSNVSIA